MEYYRVCVTRAGYATVQGNTEEEIEAAVSKLSEHDFDWEPLSAEMLRDEMEIIEKVGPNGESLH